MKDTLKFLTSIVVGGALGFVMLAAMARMTGARPWHGEPDPDVVAAAGPVQASPMASGMHGEQMPDGMMMNGMTMGPGMMGGMMAQHQETANLIDQLVASFAAVESEKDPVALKAKLVEHGTLLKQLQAKSQESMRTMGKMQEDIMKTCPMMSGGMKEGQPMKP